MLDINLVAARRAQKQRAAALMRLSVYGLLGLLLIVGLLYAWLAANIAMASGQIAECDARLNDPQLVASVTRIRFLEGEIASLQPRVDLLQKVHDSEQAWIRILQDVASSLPPNAWIASLASRRTDKGQELALRGSALFQRVVGDFMLRLQKAGWCGEAALSQVQVRSGPNQPELYEFEVAAPLKQPIGSELL